jgi:hypothetical protein
VFAEVRPGGVAGVGESGVELEQLFAVAAAEASAFGDRVADEAGQEGGVLAVAFAVAAVLEPGCRLEYEGAEQVGVGKRGRSGRPWWSFALSLILVPA